MRQEWKPWSETAISTSPGFMRSVTLASVRSIQR